jgi:matrixin
MRAGSIAAVVVVALLASVGCSRPLPGDGRLVRVRVDASLAATMVQVVRADGTLATTALGPYVTRGVRYWDAVGACLRTDDEVPAGAAIAAELHVVADSPLERLLDGAPAFYSELDGAVHVATDELRARGDTYYPEVEFAALFAHEAGHALGLAHEQPCTGVMAQRCWLPALTAADVAQFVRVQGVEAQSSSSTSSLGGTEASEPKSEPF